MKLFVVFCPDLVILVALLWSDGGSWSGDFLHTSIQIPLGKFTSTFSFYTHFIVQGGHFSPANNGVKH